MSGNNLTLGLPFYGYDFTNPPAGPSFTFRSMVEAHVDYAWVDQVGQKYNNGITTIQAKTELAILETAGVCIWELGQDAFNEYSLLNAVFEITSGAVNSDELHPGIDLFAFPNPFFDNLYLTEIPLGKNTVRLFRPDGQLIKSWVIENQPSAFLQIPYLPTGIYFLRNENAGGVTSLKLVRGS